MLQQPPFSIMIAAVCTACFFNYHDASLCLHRGTRSLVCVCARVRVCVHTYIYIYVYIYIASHDPVWLQNQEQYPLSTDTIAMQLGSITVCSTIIDWWLVDSNRDVRLRNMWCAAGPIKKLWRIRIGCQLVVFCSGQSFDAGLSWLAAAISICRKCNMHKVNGFKHFFHCLMLSQHAVSSNLYFLFCWFCF